MSDTWTIKGEAGKTVDATARSLEALHASGLNVLFRSLATDELTWTVWLKSTAEISTLVPDDGQRISLYKNGDRYFTGHVTSREPIFSAGQWGYSITVSGPWWWLATTPITSVIPDETTVNQERAIYILNTGSPTAWLASIASRAVALGMPVALGSIATCSACPRISLREMSLGEAISEVMRFVVDGLVYFDYSGADGTHPALCMQRRTPAATVEINVGTVAVPTIKLRPRKDLQIAELHINYTERETYENQRVNAFKKQSSGTSSGTRPDRQIITVTGPEMGLGLPQDLTDSVVVKSSAIAGHVGDALNIYHDLLKAGQASLAGVDAYADDDTGDIYAGSPILWPVDPGILVTDPEGNTLNLAAWPYYLTKGEIKDWWAKDGIESVQARVTATVGSTSELMGVVEDAPEQPKWARVLGARPGSYLVSEPGTGTTKVRYTWQASVSAVIPLVKTLWAANTTLIRKEDWAWFNPPAGFAAYLLATQNWLPWEGEVPIATDDSPPANLVGSVLNIAGWVPECAAMRAMISGYSVTPATGQITFSIGPPARHSYRDLVNRFRQTGADNIYWLNRSGGLSPDIGANPPPAGSIVSEFGHYEINEDGSTYPTTES